MFVAGYLAPCLSSMAAWCACQACQCASRQVLTQSARVAWSALFFVAMITAWVLRDFARPLLEKIPWIVRDAAHFDLDDKWFGQQAVYRLSMGSFLFFATMSAIMVGVKYKSDKRDKYLHHGNYLLKLGLWLVFCALPFLFPNNVIEAYGWIARFGSGLFLIVQMVILLDFVQAWNDSWVNSANEDDRWYYALTGVTVAAYSGILVLAGLMYHWFKPNGAGSCSLNVSLITTSLLAVVAFSALSLHPSVRSGSIFPASIVGLYCMYLCFSSLESEPHSYECNGLGKKITAASGTTLALSMMATLAAVVYAAFRAGSNTRLFSLEDSVDAPENAAERTALLAEEGTSAGLDGVPEGQSVNRDGARKELAIDEFQPVTYSYSFFHLIFALASMYIAMLMTGWGSEVQEKDRIDVGWSSVWVKTGAEWVTALLYCWTLIAPMVFPDRDFS